MHPSCPDFDLCADCEALPIPVHPVDHALLKIKSLKTVVPQVMRARTSDAVPVGVPSSKTKHIRVRGASASRASPVAVPAPVAEPSNVEGTPRPTVSVQTMNLLDEKNVQCGFEVENPSLFPTANVAISEYPISPISFPMPGALPEITSVGEPSFPQFDLISEDLNFRGMPFVWSPGLPAGNLFELPSPPKTEPRFEPTLPSVPKIDPDTDKIPVAISTPTSSRQESSHEQDMAEISAQAASLISNFLARPEPALIATFEYDNNVEDGHLFPPGAEFIKSWRMKNDGARDWPKETMLAFVGGHRLGAFANAPTQYEVGTVKSGDHVDVWAGDLKAPDEPGIYNSFWRLVDGQGVYFGHRVSFYTFSF